MKTVPTDVNDAVSARESSPASPEVSSPSRRKFLGKLGTAATATVAAGVLGGIPGKASAAGSNPPNPSNARVNHDYTLRVATAGADAHIPVPAHTTSGDEQLYHDKSGSYSKCILQDYIGVVDPAAWISFRKACNTGNPTDWANVIIGGTRTLNGPQGSYAYTLDGLDCCQFGNAPGVGDPTGTIIVPPFDPVASASLGTQLMELYWASLLRDVAFTDYDGNATAQAAAAELSAQPTYRGPRDSNGNVTTANLFRGVFAGELIGPYMSQLSITPAIFGAQPISQQLITYQSGIDYMLDPTTFLEVQQGIPTGLLNQPDPTPQYLHNGRGLAALTHVDIPLEEYVIALQVLNTLGAPLNPGNPYINSKNQNGFCTFGVPDFQSTVAWICSIALQKVWFQKWVIHLTLRPESAGGIVYQMLQGKQKIEATINSNFLNSQALATSLSTNNSYFLSQAFPEGSPSHPSYPTGHGTAGGAAITLIKFYYDGSWVFPNPMVPSNDGLSLNPYTGSDAGQITLAGELNKLAHNTTFGHGIHAGIHWRLDSDISMLLGEAIAIAYLQDRAKCYNEPFSVTFNKLDGNPVTITNIS